MAIVAGDLKLYESERMNENSTGGGLITGNEISCGVDNNIFPNISRIDRLYGRTQFRKVFQKVINQDLDTYSGAHIIVNVAPIDENVNIIMFDVGTKEDERSDMISYFESYYQKGIICGTATLSYQAEIGAEALVFLTEQVDKYKIEEVGGDGYTRWYWVETTPTVSLTLPVSSGDVIAIGTEFLHVNRVETQREYASESSSFYKHKYWTYTILYLAAPTTEQHVVGTQVYTRIINPAWHCFGNMNLSADVSSGETNIPVVSEKVRVMPIVNTTITINSYPPFFASTVVDGSSVGVSPNTFTLDGVLQPYVSEYKDVVPEQLVYVINVSHQPIVTSSVILWIRSQGSWQLSTDDGAGNLTDFCSGTVDYTNGVITMTIDRAADENTKIIVFYRASRSYKEHISTTIGVPGTLPRPLDFTQTSIMPGTIFFDITTASGTYPIVDANGALVPNYLRALAEGQTTGVSYGCSNQNGVGLVYPTPVYYNDGVYHVYGAKNRQEANSINGLTWNTDSNDSIVGSFQPIRAAYDSSGACVQVAGADLFHRATLGAVWEDITAEKPNPAYVYNDITWFPESFGTMVACSRATGEILTSGANYSVWYDATYNIFADRIQAGVYSGGNICVAAGNTTWTSTNLTTWTLRAPLTLGQACVAIANAANTQTWMIAGSTTLLRAKGNIFTSPTDLYPDFQNIPEVAGKSIVHVSCSPDGHWVVCFDFSNAQPYIVFSGDDGDHWVAYEVDLNGLTVNNVTNKQSSVYDPLNEQFVYVLGLFNQRDFRSNVFKVNEYPYDPIGTVDYATGLGTITAGETITSSITADYFLTEMNYKEFVFPIKVTPPIEANSIIISAKIKNTDTPVSISEVGGSIVGDGTMTINHEHGYVFGEFDDPIEIDSIEVECTGHSIYHPQYDEYDTNRMPTDGLVPACKTGDTIVLNGYKVDYDNRILDDIVVGCLIIGQTGGQQWTVAYDDKIDSTSGTLYLTQRVGDTDLVDDEICLVIGSEETGPISGGLDINSATGVERYYDACLVTGVTDGEISVAVEDGLANDYYAGSLVSTAVIAGDLQASEDTYFSESVDPGDWYDTMQGVPANGTWDSATYPAVVTNNGAVTERWAITVTATTPTRMSVEGESVGIIATNQPITSAIAPNNPNADPIEAYFTIPSAAWSAEGTHQVGNVYRFNTTGTEVPVWILRSTNARTSDTASDRFTLELRGDIP